MSMPCPFEGCGKPAIDETGMCREHSEAVEAEMGLANEKPERGPRSRKLKASAGETRPEARGAHSPPSMRPTISNTDLQKRLELLDRFGVRRFSDGMLTIERDPSANKNRKPVKPDPDEQPEVPEL